jgi:hypothetical protein
VRERGLWASSCMVAAEGGEPIAALHACKRPHATRILRLAVHESHRRRGHGRHLLTSLSSKLAILGPPRLVVELPADWTEARAFLEACGYAEEGRLSDWVLDAPSPRPAPGDPLEPVTVDELAAAGAMTDVPGLAWDREPATILARKDRLAGVALASPDGIEAWALWEGSEVAGLRCGRAADVLLAGIARRIPSPVRLSGVSELEVPAAALERHGFRRVGESVVLWVAARPA